jgi:ribosomal protein L27
MDLTPQPKGWLGVPLSAGRRYIMTGGKARPKKDKSLKVSNGQFVKTGTIVSRGMPTYKPGFNVGGLDPIFALSSGKIYFTKKKTPHGKVRTFINIKPAEK